MRLTHDEIETIRIHMNAFKENLCNQHRWKEAEEYQTIVDKLDDLMTVEALESNPCSDCQEFDCYGCDVKRKEE